MIRRRTLAALLTMLISVVLVAGQAQLALAGGGNGSGNGSGKRNAGNEEAAEKTAGNDTTWNGNGREECKPDEVRDPDTGKCKKDREEYGTNGGGNGGGGSEPAGNEQENAGGNDDASSGGGNGNDHDNGANSDNGGGGDNTGDGGNEHDNAGGNDDANSGDEDDPGGDASGHESDVGGESDNPGQDEGHEDVGDESGGAHGGATEGEDLDSTQTAGSAGEPATIASTAVAETLRPRPLTSEVGPSDDDPGAPSSGGVQPAAFTGNPTCGDLGDWTEVKVEPVSAGSYSDGTLDVTLSDVSGGYFDWSSNIGVDAVFVKGGNGGNLFGYNEATQDGNLHAPINPNNGQPYGLSHVSFCYDAPEPEPGIDVEKSCPPTAVPGEEITYTITVTNTGNEDLENLEVQDTILGDLSGAFPGTLGVGESHSEEFKHTVGDDPVHNEVTATADGAESENSVSDSASCDTTVEHEPGIGVEKSCPRSAAIGEEITYTITVTNTGNEALEDLTVIDSLLGDISDQFPGTLGVGEDATAEVKYTVQPGDGPTLHNEVTASGTGRHSEEQTSDQAGCDTEVEEGAIQLEKTGVEVAHRGDTIAYTFAVTSIGESPLSDVEVEDPNCDEPPVLMMKVGGNQDDLLESDETWIFGCTRQITETDDDPLPNTATACGTAVEEVCDEDDHIVDIIDPAIRLVKTADPISGNPGDLVTYTYLVTNTGDTTLYDVSVDDDILGHIGDIPQLAPGESETLLATMNLGDVSVVNVGTACGMDRLEEEVCDSDDAEVTPVLGEDEENPPEVKPKREENVPPRTAGGVLPFTGSEPLPLMLLAAALAAAGSGLSVAGRRRGKRGNG